MTCVMMKIRGGGFIGDTHPYNIFIIYTTKKTTTMTLLKGTIRADE